MYFKMCDQILVLVFFCLLFTTISADSHQSLRKWNSSETKFNIGQYNKETRSSIVFKLYGDVYPMGFYFANVSIGQPPKPYYLDPDTGSGITWVQCDAPCIHCLPAPHKNYRPITYPIKLPKKCGYEGHYADGLYSCGVMVNDVFSLDLSTQKHINAKLEFGCGYKQSAPGSHLEMDGVLGLRRGSNNIVSQLHNQGVIEDVIGHCLSVRGGGYLFLGDTLYNPSHLTWTSMLNDNSRYAYSATAVRVFFGGENTGIKNLNVVFDSGSTFTYLSAHTYGIVTSLVVKELQRSPLKKVNDDNTLPLCWKGEKGFGSINDVSKYFKPLTLRFSNGWFRAESQFQISPESYLIISSKHNVCMGILNGTEIGLKELNLIGDISMQDKMVIYDNQKKKIGWVSANCDHPPKLNAIYKSN